MPDLDSACPKTPITTIFLNKLTTLAICYQAIPDLEPTLPEGLLPDLPNPTQGIDTSLVTFMIMDVSKQSDVYKTERKRKLTFGSVQPCSIELAYFAQRV